MLTPSYLLHATEPAEEIAEKIHQDILRRIIERILLRFDRGDDYILTAQDKWQLETLQEAGFLLDDILKEIVAAVPYMQSELVAAMEDAGVRALEYDDALYRAAGLNPTNLTQSPNLIRIMQRDFEATLGEWENFTRTTANAAQQTFIRVCDTAYHQAMTGTVSVSQAVKEAIGELITEGIYVQYANGYKTTIEAATARAVRTGISQASAHIQLARMDEMDVDLVLVSSHLGARPSHQVWQGKVYSRSGSGDYPDFVESTGYGTVTGLCGANCRHNFGPYFEGMENPFEQYDAEENRKAYELQQKQRTMERRIRDTKRQTMNWKEAMDKETDPVKKAMFEAEYQRKAALLQNQNTAYRQFCKDNGLKLQSDRISIAKWDRQQAAMARGAAKKHYTGWLKSIGAESTSLNTLAKYLSAKYDETDEFGILEGYKRAVEKHDISPLVGLAQYKVTAAAIDDYIIGEITSTGVQIEGYVSHFIDRVIGQTADSHSGMRRGVPVEDALDAILNPISQPKIKTMADGDIRQTFTGQKAIVTISASDKILIQTNPR